ncbi:hypothetical protein GQX73_g890 [Xylaria multiplex]|uniref:Uncharacterized protein n=1 Tax=Xylaria multiplex TaxID=323545 RepID=A0A7C8IUD8_9PEZI|nr:hypothetical protein GQX73_g890 [Xylaria multiplex]
MASDNTKASRQSIDSAHSSAPLIPKSTFQPPPHYPVPRAMAASHGTATDIKLSYIVLACRLVAFISSLSIAISFAVLGVRQAEMIALVVFMWIFAVWQGLMLISLSRNPSLRMSLVMSDGRVIKFGSERDNEGGHRRRHCSPRAFWVDLLLFSVIFPLNLVNAIRDWGYYRNNLDLNWITIAFQIVITLLTASPSLVTAHIRFEPTEMPQISLA